LATCSTCDDADPRGVIDLPRKPEISELTRISKSLAEDHKRACVRDRMSTGETFTESDLMMALRKVIAIIDDNPGILQSMRTMLSSLGYDTELYATAEQFIDAAMNSEAACLLLDINLPDISGIELARHLSAMGLTFPIIFMTASEQAQIKTQAEELGCVAYLSKPFSQDQLIVAIKDAVG
jgi:CheY-like chemotaxis protein